MTKVIKVNDESHEYLASLCKKDQHFNDAVEWVIEVAKNHPKELELVKVKSH